MMLGLSRRTRILTKPASPIPARAGIRLERRRGRDLNPRSALRRITVFETAAFDRSATPPSGRQGTEVTRALNRGSARSRPRASARGRGATSGRGAPRSRRRAGTAPCRRARRRHVRADGRDDAAAALRRLVRGDDQPARELGLVERLDDEVVVERLERHVRSIGCPSSTRSTILARAHRPPRRSGHEPRQAVLPRARADEGRPRRVLRRRRRRSRSPTSAAGRST